jgi:hypothetical protein
MLLSLQEQNKIRHFGNSLMGCEIHWTTCISEQALRNYVETENKFHNSE